MKRRSLLKTASYASATLMLQGLAKTANASEGLSVVLDNLHQAPLNTTLLGVMRGVADFYGIEISDATLFGATGHAFIINIHPTLDPSGPYVWDRTHFTRLARNIGLQITNLGFFSPASSLTERQEVEATLGEALDVDIPCSLINLENQLIMGYDETGLLTARPQPQMNFIPRHLTFGSWDELGSRFHVNFYAFRRIEPAKRIVAVRESLEYAVDVLRRPQRHTHRPYGMGLDAYDNFLSAIDEYGSSHGNWWNSIVWAECRRHAGAYMAEIAQWFPAMADSASRLAKDYASIADGLSQALDRNMPGAQKKRLVAKLKDQEVAAVKAVERILAVL